jgi:predicted transcriptional regulator
MARPGPEKRVSDLRLLLELGVKDEFVFAKEIMDEVSLEAVQTVRDRLNELVAQTEYVELKKVSNRNLYRLTESGRQRLLEELRTRLD